MLSVRVSKLQNITCLLAISLAHCYLFNATFTVAVKLQRATDASNSIVRAEILNSGGQNNACNIYMYEFYGMFQNIQIICDSI